MERQRLWLGAGLILLLALAYHFVGLAVVPPGLDRDAAANGWQALKWLRYGIVPFWMPHASAPEPLIVWLQTATTALLGPSVLALRSASAIFLSLAAVVVYWLTLEVAKPFTTTQRWWAAILAGLTFACNPLVTQLARTGLRATTLPLLSALFFLCLLRAWRTNARRDYLISGAALGVAAYTYLAARFLPIVVLLFVAIALSSKYRDRYSERSEESPSAGGRLIGLVLMAFAALIVVSPQLIFFSLYPSAFWERAQSVTLLSNPAYGEMGLAKLLFDKVVAMALIFGVEWSGQYNQAARPLLLPLPFVGLLLALPLVWRWRRQPAMLLMIVAFLIMLLPDLIGGDRVMPHELRVIGAFVPTMVLSGIGLASGLGWLMRFASGFDSGKVAGHVGGALLTLLIAGWGIYDWFGVAAPALAKSDYEWFARPDVAFADAVNSHDAPMLVPLNDYSRSVIAYLTAKGIEQLGSGIDLHGQVVQPSSERVLLLWPAVPERPRVESISYRFDAQSLVLIDGGRAYLMPPAAADVAQLQSECVAEPFTTSTGEAAGTLCELDFAQFNFPAQFPAQLPTQLWSVNDLYDGNLRLRGISADTDTLTPGTTLGITSFWQAEPHSLERWRYFVHLLDDRQTLVTGDDLIPGYGVYDTQLWQQGEIVPIRQAVQLPDNLPAGRYWIEVGLYDPLSGERAVVSESWTDRTLVGPLKVPLQERAELPDAIERMAHFGNEIVLDGYQFGRSDGELQVTLRLAALRQPERDYTVFVHIESASGEIMAQSDAQPLDGQYPTAIWDAGEAVVSTWRVSLPPTLKAGSYRVWLGLYNGQDGTRLPVVAAGATVDGNRLLLSEIKLP
jgi:4-amino-4-deoxy-L-arabinose transferase-like glycosyltransferase